MVLIHTHVLPLLFLLTLGLQRSIITADNNSGFSFIFNDSQIVGVREIEPSGQVVHTHDQTQTSVGHTFYSHPFRFKNSTSSNAFSFSTSFVFGIIPSSTLYTFHGMTFAITPSKAIINTSTSEHLGLFNRTNDGNASNHIVAVELDIFKNVELSEIDSNHVGLDINSVVSVFATTAGYYEDENGDFKNLTFSSSQEIQTWIDYNGDKKQLNITLAPLNLKKPKKPLASIQKDLSPFLLEEMYVGFTSATGLLLQTDYHILAWSFQINGRAQEFDVSKIPSLPLNKKKPKTKHLIPAIGLSLGGLLLLITSSASIWGIVLHRRRSRKFAEVLEDWEVQYGPHRFSYKDLYKSTKGFKETELLGKGGFGKVYKGTLPEVDTPVAVKKVRDDSGRGMKEFVAEIATIGRLRHPNLVRLLGYCRRKHELFLVYDYMPNSSLDRLLFNSKSNLNCKQRMKIIIDVAEALAYLHEQWVEVIIHRDIKASNVLLDAELNAKLGDFGLARVTNNGNEAKTTRLAGTLGYIAPELARKGKATTATDVFAFGAFCLEVICGRRPVELQRRQEEVILVEWVLDCWFKERLLNVIDPKVENELDFEEMGLVLKIGLLCSHGVPSVRPSMLQVLKFLKKEEPLPEDFNGVLGMTEGRVCDALRSGCFSNMECDIMSSMITDSLVHSGR